jgi:amino acid transporter
MTFQKPFEPIDAAPHTPVEVTASTLHRNLGVWSIAFMALAGASPLGAVIVAVPIVAAVSQNPALPLFFLGATVILTVFTIGFTRMARHVANAGAFYSYIQAGLGRITGTGAATFAMTSYTMLSVGTVIYLGVVSADAIHQLTGVSSPWWIWTAAWWLIISTLGYRDIELSAKVLGVVLVLEIVVVIVIDMAVILNGGAVGVTAASLNPTLLSDGFPSLGLMLAFLSFIGFEATAVFRNEARDPERTIPRATYIAVIGVGLFYAFAAWAITVGVGVAGTVAAATSDPAGIMPGLAGKYVSPIMQDITMVLLVSSMFACVLTFHNVLTRYVYTVANKGVLPRRLGEVSRKHRAPSRASITVTIVIGVLVVAVSIPGWDPVAEVYTWLAGGATLGVIVLMALSSLAVLVFFWKRADARSGVWSTTMAPLVALVCLTALVGLVVRNFAILVPDQAAASVLLVVLFASFGLGVGIAMVFRARRPAAYQALDG